MFLSVFFSVFLSVKLIIFLPLALFTDYHILLSILILYCIYCLRQTIDIINNKKVDTHTVYNKVPNTKIINKVDNKVHNKVNNNVPINKSGTKRNIKKVYLNNYLDNDELDYIYKKLKSIDHLCYSNRKLRHILCKLVYKDSHGNYSIRPSLFNRNLDFKNTRHRNIDARSVKVNTLLARKVIQYSDKTLKKNIKSINPNEALIKVNQLQGVTYNWKDQDSTEQSNNDIGLFRTILIFPIICNSL
jgi:hypothetical protein